MSYSVFIERALDASPDGVRAVAERVGKRFGAPTEALMQRLSQGPFRVKANVDLDKARRFAEELTRLGAEAGIYDASGQKIDADGKPAAPAAAKPPPPATAKPPEKPALPAAETEGAGNQANQYQTGLAAAFTGDSGQQDLGALSGGDLDTSGSLRLSSLDGEDGGTVAEDERAPSAAIAPAAVAENAFLPPELSEEAKDLELLTPLPEAMPSPESAATAEANSAPPAAAASPPPADPLAQESAPGKGPPAWLQSLAENSRNQLVFAVVISLLVGFALAHVMATMQEDSAYAEIRQEVTTVQSKVNNTDDWNKLDALRASALERMAAKKRSIAISSAAIMLVGGGLLTFLIVRKVPWDRYVGSTHTEL